MHKKIKDLREAQLREGKTISRFVVEMEDRGQGKVSVDIHIGPVTASSSYMEPKDAMQWLISKLGEYVPAEIRSMMKGEGSVVR